jgi:IS1 family transposase
MNRLSVEKRSQILAMLCEGMSMRSVSRIADVSINTVSKLLVDAGKFCSAFHDDNVRGVKAKRVQCDEVWSFCYAKQRNVDKAKAAPGNSGDVWTWTAIDADSKLIVSWLVGGRDAEYAHTFMHDLAERIDGRVQLTTDGLSAYINAVEGAFGADVDFAQLVKIYGEGPKTPERKYSPNEFVCAQTRPIEGSPDHKHVSTSYVERSNLTIRMAVRRYTRLTNAFSKKFENHMHMVAIYTVFYNWLRIHTTLKVTPAMEAGLTERIWEWSDLLEAMDAEAPTKKRGPYKKNNSN